MGSKDSRQLNSEAASLRREKPEECAKIATEALQLAESVNDLSQQANAYHNLAEASLWSSNYDDALNYSFQAKKIYKQLKDVYSLGEVHYTIGTTFFYLSAFNDALEEYMNSLQSFNVEENKQGKAKAYNGIGSVYYSIGENKKAIDYLEESRSICLELNDNILLQKVLDGLGKSYANLDRFDDAITTLEACVNLVTENKDRSHVIAHAYNNMGLIYLKKGVYEVAIDYFQRSLDIREKIGFITGWSGCLCNIGRAQIELGALSKAEQSIAAALELAIASKSKNYEALANELLAEVYEKKGDLKNALAYYKAFHKVNDQLKELNNKKVTKSLQMKLKADQEEQEKKLLQQKNEGLKKYSSDLVRLSEIGKKLTALLSADEIIKCAYEEINELMDAPSFGLGIFNDEDNILLFPGYCEDGENIGDATYDLNQSDRLASICFLEKKEIIINDIETEHQLWLSEYKAPKIGRQTVSIIYLPFDIPNGASGVITVQSYKKNAYDKHQVNIVRNLAVFMATALENARLYQSLEAKVVERTAEIRAQKEKMERSYRVSSLLSEVGRQLTSSTDFETIFLKLHKHVSDLMDASCFGVRLYHKETNEIEYKFELENGEVDRESIFVPMDDENNYSVICVKNNRVILINDNEKEFSKWTKEIVVPTGEMPHSLIFYPMTFAGEVMGLITVQSFQRNAYTEEHLEILKTLAAFTAVSLENVNLVDNLEQKVAERTTEIRKQKEEVERTHEHTQLLNEIGREITSTLSIKDVIEKVYENINKLMDASIIGVGIVNGNELEIKGAIENGVKLPDFSFSLSDDTSLAIQCLHGQKEMLIHDLDKEILNYVKKDNDTKVGNKPKSIMYIPLVIKGKGIGTISVQSFQSNAYTDYHLNILRNLALYTSTAIENAGLYKDMEEKVIERTKEVVQQKEEIEKTYENTKVLSKMGQSIISTHNLERIFDKMHENVNQLMDAPIFSIRICDYDRHEIDYRYTIESGKRLKPTSISMDDYDNYSVWCLRNKKDIHISDHAKEYKKYTNKIVVVDGELPESLIFCPMMIGSKVIGIISAQSFEKHAYSEYHLDILRTIAAYSAIALENANLIHDMENQVKIRTAEVVRQKEIIEEKNKDITDSIQYAQRIQNVILPPMNEFEDNFVESFVMFRPRDIVSGDFYWIEEVDDKIYFSVVDCTGHGVPGALVSVVGANSLNRCLMEFELRDPGEILNKLSELVKETFDKTDSNVRDGMDMALCCIDKNTRELSFSGAYNPLWLIRENDDSAAMEFEQFNVIVKKNKTFVEIKSNKRPIGYSYRSEPFNTTSIQLKENDMIYLFSDGYADQFGGTNEEVIAKGGKKFKTINFKRLLMSMSHIALEEQLDIIEETFDTWKGELPQVDDVCVIGVRI